jgi:sterol desaturase/sphingolipid hydroxylase (fatty acid hydroxylase superfamily)
MVVCSNGLRQGDIGAFLYRHVHSFHHRSRNPGPWSGLSMHPIKHFFYYTSAYIPLLFTCHPLHFLYTKFHLDIALIGAYDGYDDPAGAASFHYLHHAMFECNYGSPLISFDRLFGTHKEFVKPSKIKKFIKITSIFIYIGRCPRIQLINVWLIRKNFSRKSGDAKQYR